MNKFFTILLMLVAVNSFAQDSLEFEQNIRKYLSFGEQNKKPIMESMMNQFKAANPNAFNSNRMESFKNKIDSMNHDYLEAIIPYYKKYYTNDEIKELIKFNESDLGKKVLQNNALIAQNGFLEMRKITEKYLVFPKTDLKKPPEPLPLPGNAPQFPNGFKAMYNFINENMHYPPQAKIDKVEGRVFVKFVIEADGKLDKIFLLKGVRKDLDDEAIRILESMPKWIPALKDGKEVASDYTLPITFSIN